MRFCLLMALCLPLLAVADSPKAVLRRPNQPDRTPVLHVPESAEAVFTFEETMPLQAGSWKSDLQDNDQSCTHSLREDDEAGGDGHCLQIMYDVDSPLPAANGIWLKPAQTISLFDRTSLRLNLRGDVERGFPQRLKVELKTRESMGTAYLEGISPGWQCFTLELAKLAIPTRAELVELVFVFEDQTTTPKTGRIFVDTIFVQ